MLNFYLIKSIFDYIVQRLTPTPVVQNILLQEAHPRIFDEHTVLYFII